MWKIDILENTLEINKKTAKELFALSAGRHDGLWYDLSEVNDGGRLSFNDDFHEHMDFLYKPEYNAILKKNKAKGLVTFGCLDGDQFGLFWGYRFDGKGGAIKLVGELSWKVENDL